MLSTTLTVIKPLEKPYKVAEEEISRPQWDSPKGWVFQLSKMKKYRSLGIELIKGGSLWE
jgi:hypothetical protein